MTSRRKPSLARTSHVERRRQRSAMGLSGLIAETANGTIDSRLRAFVLLAGFGGLRGAATGRTVRAERQGIDPLRETVHVRREAHEIAHVRDPDGSIVKKYGRTITEPKSEAGKRTVALPRAVMDELRAHVDAFAAPGLTGMIFTRSDWPLPSPS